MNYNPRRGRGVPPWVARVIHLHGFIGCERLGAASAVAYEDRGHGNGLGIYDDLADLAREREEPWRAEAACRGLDPAEFFPTPSGRYVAALHLARDLCPGCPVREPCGLYADQHRLEGCWGGHYRNRKLYAEGPSTEVPYTVKIRVVSR